MEKQGRLGVPDQCAELFSRILMIAALIGIGRGGHLLIGLLAALAVERIARNPAQAIVARIPALGTVRALFTTRLAVLAVAVAVVLLAIDLGPRWVAGGVAFWLVAEWFSRPSLLRGRDPQIAA